MLMNNWVVKGIGSSDENLTHRRCDTCKLTTSMKMPIEPQAPDVINFSCNKKYIPYLYNTKVTVGNNFFLFSTRLVTSFFAWNSAIKYFCDPFRLPVGSFNILANETLCQNYSLRLQLIKISLLILCLLLHICKKWLKGGGCILL